MATVLEKTVTRADKGQRSLTVSRQNQKRTGTSTSTSSARTDTQTASGAVYLDLEFTIPFIATKPVLPIGEVEPTGTGC